MPEIDPNTGLAVCPYGTEIQPSFDEMVIDLAGGAVLALIFGPGAAGILAPAIAALGVHEIVVADLCKSPPPLPANWTLSDTISALQVLNPDPRVFGKLLDWLAVGAWKLACQCKPVQIPGWQNSSCGFMHPNNQNTSISTPFPWDGGNVGGLRVTYDIQGAGSHPVDVAVQALNRNGDWVDSWGIRAQPGGAPYADDLTTTAGGWLADAGTHTARLRSFSLDAGVLIDMNWCVYTEPLQVTAPEPVGPSIPPTPIPLPPGYQPPPVLTGTSVDLTDLHELRKFVMPASWVPGPAFVVSGAGSHALPYGTTGLKVEVSDVAPGADVDAGNPPVYYALGWLAPESTAGARIRWRLDKREQLLWGLYGTETTLQYNIYPPASATITPLMRP